LEPKAIGPFIYFGNTRPPMIQRSNEWQSGLLHPSQINLKGDMNGRSSSTQLRGVDAIVKSLRDVVANGCTKGTTSNSHDRKTSEPNFSKLSPREVTLSTIKYVATSSAISQLRQQTIVVMQQIKSKTSIAGRSDPSCLAVPWNQDASSFQTVSNYLKVISILLVSLRNVPSPHPCCTKLGCPANRVRIGNCVVPKSSCPVRLLGLHHKIGKGQLGSLWYSRAVVRTGGGMCMIEFGHLTTATKTIAI
jgi:hypothetical protein